MTLYVGRPRVYPEFEKRRPPDPPAVKKTRTDPGPLAKRKRSPRSSETGNESPDQALLTLKSARLAYLLSFPERSSRALVALATGVVKPLADHLLPASIRSSRTYETVIGRFERFLVEKVAGVQGVYEGESDSSGRFLARKGAGNVIELATFAGLGVSPVWFLAMASDVSRGTRTFLDALVAELEREGVPLDGRNIQTVDGLLEALEKAFGTGAGVVDMPPLDLAGLRATWETFRSSREPLPDRDAMAALFRDLQTTAAQTGGSLLSISSLSGIGTLAGRAARGAARTTRRGGRAAANLISAHVVEDYRRTLREIREQGPQAYASRVVMPYLQAIRRHYDPHRETFTERRLRRR
jgi:hypothetical protein